MSVNCHGGVVFWGGMGENKTFPTSFPFFDRRITKQLTFHIKKHLTGKFIFIQVKHIFS